LSLEVFLDLFLLGERIGLGKIRTVSRAALAFD